MKAAYDETQPMLHAGYAMSTLYAQHVRNLLHEFLRQNASTSAKECREYRDLLMESQVENDHLRALIEAAREDEEYAKKYSQCLDKGLAERDKELLEKDVHIRARDIELRDKDKEIAQRQAQIVQHGAALHQLQEHVQVWLSPLEEPEEDPEEIQGMSDVDDK
jgi:uncharacterized protein (DUF3084 family)